GIVILSTCRSDIQSRLEVLVGTLPDNQIRLFAAHDGVMGVSGAGWGLKIPDDGYLGMLPLERVVDLAIRKNGEVSLVVFVLLQEIGNFRQAGYLFKLVGRHGGRPTSCRQQLNIRFVIDNLFGETLPLYQIDQVRSDIDNALSLLLYVKKPRGSDKWLAGNLLKKVMYTLLGNRRLIDTADYQLA